MATPIPSNEASFTLSEVLEATGGRVLFSGGSSLTARGVTTDSRAALKGRLFVALKGENFDAHAFLGIVREGAASLVIVEEREDLRRLLVEQGYSTAQETAQPAVVAVADTLVALGALAQHHRTRWQGKLIAVAGSAGKTTTRSVIFSLLSHRFPGRVHATRGNLNNRIGVPMTLLGLLEEHDFAVVELGTNCPGEVRCLTEMSRPDVAVLTLIDLEHTEGLGDLEGVEREESQVLSLLSEQGVAVGFGEDERVSRCITEARCGTRLRYGTQSGFELRILSRRLIRPESEEVVLEREDGSRLSVNSPLVGKPGALALAAAILVVENLTQNTLSATEAELALARAGERGRANVLKLKGDVIVVDDSYNASPASVEAAILTGEELSRLSGGRLWLVLGEMLELGELSFSSHQAMGQRAGESLAEGAAFIQGDAQFAYNEAKKRLPWCRFFSDASAVSEELALKIDPGDVVVVKASRGVRAERVVEGLAARLGVMNDSSGGQAKAAPQGGVEPT